MALFRRRSSSSPEDPAQGVPAVGRLDGESGPDAAPEGEPGVDRAWDRTVDGPFDSSERPEMAGRIDLGALRVPPARGLEVRLEIDKSSARVVGAICVVGESRMQLQVFAAPRSFGIWQEIRTEIADSIRAAGGTAEEADGVLGTELRARMASTGRDGKVTYQPARFVGVDGPRWFLRGAINGPATGDERQLRALLGYLRQVVVHRGDEPRPPREVLALTAPERNAEAVAAKIAQVSGRPTPRPPAPSAGPAAPPPGGSGGLA